MPPQQKYPPRLAEYKENLGLGHAPRARASARTPTASHFDSLQELLEREGYRETRIVTPIGVGLPAEGVSGADGEMPHAGPPGVAATDAPPDDPRFAHVNAWMRTVMAASEEEEHAPPVDPPLRLQNSRSEAAMQPRGRLSRKRSSVLDASLAYQSGRPAPPPQALAAAAAPTAAAPTLVSAPAEPLLSLQDAEAPRRAEPRAWAPRLQLRRAKSEDLLQKALKARRANAAESEACTCGRARTVRRGRAPRDDARFHAAGCPVRQRWEARMDGQAPPPPPTLMLSSPRGVSSPKQLELVGREFDALDLPGGTLPWLWRHLQRPRLGLLKRATVAGLNTLFKGEERSTHAPNPLLRGARNARRARDASGGRMSPSRGQFLSSSPRRRRRADASLAAARRRSGPMRAPSMSQPARAGAVVERAPEHCEAAEQSHADATNSTVGLGLQMSKPTAGTTPDDAVFGGGAPPAQFSTLARFAQASGSAEADELQPADSRPGTLQMAMPGGLHDPPVSAGTDTSDETEVDLAQCHQLLESPTMQRCLQWSNTARSLPMMRGQRRAAPGHAGLGAPAAEEIASVSREAHRPEPAVAATVNNVCMSEAAPRMPEAAPAAPLAAVPPAESSSRTTTEGHVHAAHPVSGSTSNVRKMSKLRPSTSGILAAAAPLGSRNGFASGLGLRQGDADVPAKSLARTQSGILRPRRKPSTMALGLGLGMQGVEPSAPLLAQPAGLTRSTAPPVPRVPSPYRAAVRRPEHRYP